MRSKEVQILIVEDDDIDAESVMRGFQKARIANPTFRAKDGIHALELLHGRNGAQKISYPRILLVDINMPRMNGLELIQAVRNDEELHNSIIFVLTTSQSEKDKIAAYNLNVAGYIVKSSTGHDFMDMINMLGYFWRIVELP